MTSINKERIDRLYEQLSKVCKATGYYLNPDKDFVYSLLEGLMVNENRYGYQACPCRLADGNRDKDLDIICPCDYRDQDISEYGACYCALYVSAEIASGQKLVKPVPERRDPDHGAHHDEHEIEEVHMAGLPFPVWRCKVCGYLCARMEPPEICPICKVKKERFERFI